MRDVAVSSFSVFHGVSRPTGSVLQNTPKHFISEESTGERRSGRIVVQNPPEHIVAKQGGSQNSSRMNSLNDALAGDLIARNDNNEPEDDLFAVKLSPRSPEMTKSPFSFTTKDTAPWLKDNDE